MSNSSTASRQLEFELEVPAGGGNSSHSSDPIGPSDRQSATAFGSGLLGRNSADKQLLADTTRMTGRLNAANVSDEELNSLLRERQRLLDLKFEGTMTRSDELRLQYVRWTLDRIEDARTGEDLAAFEAVISAYEQFGEHVGQLTQELRSHTDGGEQRKKRRK